MKNIGIGPKKSYRLSFSCITIFTFCFIGQKWARPKLGKLRKVQHACKG